MKFIEIDDREVYPGEYILHKPSSAIVIVGAFNREKNMVRVFKDGKLFEDKIKNFSKISLDRQEHRNFKDKTCKKCKGARK
jgi:hypothetical protein